MPKAGKCRQPLDGEMLRISSCSSWFSCLTPHAEDAIYDSESMRRSSWSSWRVVVAGRDHDFGFRHRLEQHVG